MAKQISAWLKYNVGIEALRIRQRSGSWFQRQSLYHRSLRHALILSITATGKTTTRPTITNFREMFCLGIFLRRHNRVVTKPGIIVVTSYIRVSWNAAGDWKRDLSLMYGVSVWNRIQSSNFCASAMQLVSAVTHHLLLRVGRISHIKLPRSRTVGFER